MLEIRSLRAGYGKVEILRGIDIDVGQHEIVAVLGSNGVGKTTLNNNISALYRPFGGSIKFKGEEMLGLSSTEVVKRGLIHVPEGRRVFPNLNVRENLELGSLVRGRARREQVSRRRSSSRRPSRRLSSTKRRYAPSTSRPGPSPRSPTPATRRRDST